MQSEDLVHGEGEIGVREGLIAEREVPPLTVEGLETMAEHGFAEDHPVGELLRSDAPAHRTLVVVPGIFSGFRIATEIRMTLGAEPVKGSSHVNFLSRDGINDCQVNS